MPVDWKHKDSFTRLLAAMVAAQDMKLDYRRIATMYGRGATYDSIEGRFRIIKREAAALKAEAESGPTATVSGPTATVKDELDGHDIISRSQIATPKKGRAPKTPVKKETGILGGRVNKSANSTPTTKQRKAGAAGNMVRGMKEEILSSGSSIMEENMMSSFSTQEMGMEDWCMGDVSIAVGGTGNDNAFQGLMMGSSADAQDESYDMV